MKIFLSQPKFLKFVTGFLLSVVTICQSQNIGVNPADLFIITYDFKCKDERNLMDALVESKVVLEEHAKHFERRLSASIEATRARRLQEVVGPHEEAPKVDIAARRRLSEMTWEDRRDQMIGALDLIAKRKGRPNSFDKIMEGDRENNDDDDDNSSSIAPTVSVNFLRNVGADVIDNSRMADGVLLQFASGFPCLAHPPEMNQIIGSVSSAPDDYSAAKQYYLKNVPVGIGVEDVWDCKTGNGAVVAVRSNLCV